MLLALALYVEFIKDKGYLSGKMYPWSRER
jgi:hypothetical protein